MSIATTISAAVSTRCLQAGDAACGVLGRLSLKSLIGSLLSRVDVPIAMLGGEAREKHAPEREAFVPAGPACVTTWGGSASGSGGRGGVGAYVEVVVKGDRDRVPLSEDRLAIGQSSTNDIPLNADPTVSRLHAVLECLPSGWCIRDLNSRNGTFLNGERVWGERPVRPGDEIRVGQTTLVFRVDAPADQGDPTAGADRPPELTRREHDVLLALCAPLASEDVFRQPASIRAIASALVVTEAAVKKHLARLYDKFRIYGEGETRRLRLANEVIRRQALTMAEIQAWVRSMTA